MGQKEEWQSRWKVEGKGGGRVKMERGWRWREGEDEERVKMEGG